MSGVMESMRDDAIASLFAQEECGELDSDSVNIRIEEYREYARRVAELVEAAKEVSTQYKNVRRAEGYPTETSRSTDRLDDAQPDPNYLRDAAMLVAAYVVMFVVIGYTLL